MSKKIFTVGFDVPGGDAEYLAFRSNQSLLDADIIVFEPSFLCEYSFYDQYKGKPLLSQSDSFKIQEDTSHWRAELEAAFDEGKTVFVFLSKFESVFRHTGNKEYSGTGRNRVTTDIVNPFNNYLSLPIEIDRIVPKGGKEIRVNKDLSFLSAYWNEFKAYSLYEVYLEGNFSQVVLTTKTGDKVVGAVITGQKGNFILLPPLRYPVEEFSSKNGENWNAKGMQFGKKFISALVEIDKVLNNNRESTPTPTWASCEEYRLEAELVHEKKIENIALQIEKLQANRRKFAAELENSGGLRRLLFEKGTQLEEAILEALRLMRFEAANYKQSESEFDAVFSSEEGRFLGEAEGKDNKLINIDKLSQLERNIQEDFARDEVNDFAKGVLFGNAHRLIPPAERTEHFTQKCISGAQRLKVALVQTPDLFTVSKYLKSCNDPVFAKSCREAIMQAEGSIVQFPVVPISESATVKVQDDSPR